MSSYNHTTSGRAARDARKTFAIANGSLKRDAKVQLQRLDERLGVGVGATKERGRLGLQLKSAA